MLLKTNLHFHTSDDPEDTHINYTFYEAVDRAAELNFAVLALTCHDKYINSDKYQRYAANKNVLLIPGIEKKIEKRDVIILNADSGVQEVNTFTKLKKYKEGHPDIFVIAPHPYFYSSYCLKEKLESNIGLFDAVECSWFYSKRINCNKRGEQIAQKYRLPFIATSDTHNLEFLYKNYALVDAGTKTKEAVFHAIRNHHFKNITSPSKFWREMIWKTVIGGHLKF